MRQCTNIVVMDIMVTVATLGQWVTPLCLAWLNASVHCQGPNLDKIMAMEMVMVMAMTMNNTTSHVIGLSNTTLNWNKCFCEN